MEILTSALNSLPYYPCSPKLFVILAACFTKGKAPLYAIFCVILFSLLTLCLLPSTSLVS